jgi:hypothetical protein
MTLSMDLEFNLADMFDAAIKLEAGEVPPAPETDAPEPEAKPTETAPSNKLAQLIETSRKRAAEAPPPPRLVVQEPVLPPKVTGPSERELNLERQLQSLQGDVATMARAMTDAMKLASAPMRVVVDPETGLPVSLERVT